MKSNDCFQKGMTLVEALVAVSVFLISTIILSSFIVLGYKEHLRTREEALATDRININVQNMVEEIREARPGDNGAFPIESASPNELIFYGDIDKDLEVEKVRYYLDGDTLHKEVVQPVGIPPSYGGASDEKEIADKLTNNGSEHIFTYWGFDPLGEGNNVELNYPMDKTRIRLVTINLRTPVETTDVERIIESKVYIRNLRDY